MDIKSLRDVAVRLDDQNVMVMELFVRLDGDGMELVIRSDEMIKIRTRLTRTVIENSCRKMLKRCVSVMDEGYTIINLEKLDPLNINDLYLSKFLDVVLQFTSQRLRPIRGSAMSCYWDMFESPMQAARRALPVLASSHDLPVSIPSIGFSSCPCLQIDAEFMPRVPLGGVIYKLRRRRPGAENYDYTAPLPASSIPFAYIQILFTARYELF
ncbi:hypothetical protein HPP92_005261 [Vanilla planifolia]|uniref:Uncharacterized protein n=1 Tax=Vanilla planifolia TaxID=51239 RepID=A0A835RJX9_VANPL|nr:hypothetical protein HPP92_005261 [Vanilla planifolia]